LRNFDQTDDKLTQLLFVPCPFQLPPHFQIVTLPNKISLWLTSLLQKLPVKEQLQETHMRTMLCCGNNSPSTLDPLALATKSSSTPSQDPDETRSLALLPWLSGKENFRQQLMTPWLWEQSKIPSWMYL
jgi:hypothetical protein